jgi:hypothetical protein
MGNKIKDIGHIRLGKNVFAVELNNPEALEKEIHIQNESLRLAFGERIFYKIGAEILLAKKQLMIIKELDSQIYKEE